VVWSTLLSISLGVSMMFWFLLPGSIAGITLLLALLSLGRLRPQSMEITYRAWNKAARLFARCARGLIVGLCFAVVTVAPGRARASLKLSRPHPTTSLWTPKQTLSANGYFQLYNGPSTRGAGDRRWIRHYLTWALHTRHGWAVCLLPFLIMLRAFGTNEPEKLQQNMYTLF
jgi:hypothetical protein